MAGVIRQSSRLKTEKCDFGEEEEGEGRGAAETDSDMLRQNLCALEGRAVLQSFKTLP